MERDELIDILAPIVKPFWNLAFESIHDAISHLDPARMDHVRPMRRSESDVVRDGHPHGSGAGLMDQDDKVAGVLKQLDWVAEGYKLGSFDHQQMAHQLRKIAEKLEQERD